jgi:hypothetical protein
MSTYQRFSHLRFTQRFIIIACICWFVHNILLLIYWDASSDVCTVMNPNYSIYFSHFTLPVLYACLPIGIISTFSLLAFHRARTLASRQLNIVRLSRDRQLTAMLLVHVIYTVIVLIPFMTFYIYSLNTIIRNAEQHATNALIFTVTILIEYSMFAVSNTYRRSEENNSIIGHILYLLLCFETFSQATCSCTSHHLYRSMAAMDSQDK